MSETSTAKPEQGRAPEGSLAAVRETFGTLLVNEGAGAVLHKDYQGQGDRILINTTAEVIRGPKSGSSHEGGTAGTAFIDLALTPELAEKVHAQLGHALEELKKK